MRMTHMALNSTHSNCLERPRATKADESFPTPVPPTHSQRPLHRLSLPPQRLHFAVRPSRKRPASGQPSKAASVRLPGMAATGKTAFIGDLHPSVTEVELYHLFSKVGLRYLGHLVLFRRRGGETFGLGLRRSIDFSLSQVGKVVSVRVVKDRVTRKPRGYGYVNFESEDGEESSESVILCFRRAVCVAHCAKLRG